VAALPFVMLSGTRTLFIFIFVPVMAIVMLRVRGRLSVSRILPMVVLGVMLIAVVQLQLAVRDKGWDQIDEGTVARVLKTSVTGQFSAMLFAQTLVPSQHGYFLELAEPYFLIHWVPRRFWPQKPVMSSWSYYNDAYLEGSGAFNATPSVIGQFHMNWGMPGVLLIGVWLGFLTYLTDRLLLAVDLNRQRAMAVAIGTVYAFVISSFRFYSPIYLTFVVFAFIGMFLITRRSLESPDQPSEAPSPASPRAGTRGLDSEALTPR
jgi:hypothetical protein